MSASSKKKLRKEQQAAALTEKQLREQKEAKKLKAYSITFVVILLAIVVTAVGVMGFTAINRTGIIDKLTVAATIGDYKLDNITMTYYYNDTISNTYAQLEEEYGDSLELYLSLMNLDPSKPLGEQQHPEGGTWADHFIHEALETARRDHALANAAAAAGFTLSDDDKASIQNELYNMMFYAVYIYGLEDLDAFLEQSYCFGADTENYTAYREKNLLATQYYNKYSEELTFTDDQIGEFVKDKTNDYVSFNYASYYLNIANFLPEDVSLSAATAEQKDAAAKAAMEAADTLKAATTVEEFDAAIKALSINAEKTNAASDKYEDTFYNKVGTTVRSWIADQSRQANEIGIIPYETTTSTDGKETTTLNGYYVVFFQNRNENERKLANVRHLLVAFNDDNSTPTDAEKTAAKEKAELLLGNWKKLNGTEEDFIKLIKNYTDDEASASEGGLYEDVYPGSGYVEAFEDWAFDAARQKGDTGIVETTYGYHIMYYVGDAEESYRDRLIFIDMRSEALSDWLTAQLEATPIEEGNTSRLNKNMVISAA